MMPRWSLWLWHKQSVWQSAEITRKGRGLRRLKTNNLALSYRRRSAFIGGLVPFFRTLLDFLQLNSANMSVYPRAFAGSLCRYSCARALRSLLAADEPRRVASNNALQHAARWVNLPMLF